MRRVNVRRWCGTAVVSLLTLGVVPATASGAVPAWTTYRHDAARSGIDPDSTSPVTPTQDWQTPALDGKIYGQPLVYGSRVYVATENDTVYALDAATGAVVWQQHVATAVSSGKLSCGDISPTVGITSTPVIDPSTNRIYVVADTWNGTSISHQMYALNLADGSIGVGPVPVDPPASTPKDQLQRASLALDAGKVLIGYGGNDGDCGSYHGWLVAVPEGGGGLQTFEADSQAGDSAGAIWGSGNAPAVDSAGDIWISTGNGNSTSFDFSESVIKLDSNLNVLDWWAPSNWSTLDSNDTDLGSSMPVLLPGGLVFEIGKAGVGYLLDASSLGHTDASPAYHASVCSGSWGGAIYADGVIYVTCADGLYALTLNVSVPSFALGPRWTVNSSAQGPPIYAGGLIWSTGNGIGGSNGNLYALDPGSGSTRFSVNLGSFVHFASPSAGGGRLFVANLTKVTAFQVANAPGATATSTALSASSNPVKAGQSVTYTAQVTPAPDGGSVRFTDGGSAMPGCAGVAISAGQASCTTTFPLAKPHTITATYSGDSYYAGSSSSLTQLVSGTPPIASGAAPVVSHLRVIVVRHKLRIRLVLSETARLVVVVSRLAPGHGVHHHCRASARYGRRCTAAVRKLSLRLPGRAGRNSFHPRMRALPAGRYSISVIALGPSGRRSKPRTVVVVVRRS